MKNIVDNFNASGIEQMLSLTGIDEELLYKSAGDIKQKVLGSGVYLRGLIEISNRCTKDCYYCGIRRSNLSNSRYDLSDEEILGTAQFAMENHFGSIAIQGGERSDKNYILRIEKLLKTITKLSNGELGITISLGEQTEDTYRRWLDAGAHRYLLRIETTNPELYKRIHPNDSLHNFENRLRCIQLLQKCGYQTGTGVMIGLPFQTLRDLSNDLLFIKESDIDMVGMGPYLEHHETPLYAYRDQLLPQRERLRLSLHMVAILRLMMPDINIAATTALQAIDPAGRIKALEIGANVVMPNITPTDNRTLYQLYENKPGTNEGAKESMKQLEESILASGNHIAYNKPGTPLHFLNRK